MSAGHEVAPIKGIHARMFAARGTRLSALLLLLLVTHFGVARKVLATEKLFLFSNHTCYIAAGQVWVSTGNEWIYSEILGSMNNVSAEVCGKSYFDTRSCRTYALYNFQLACRDGVATAPQLFMALFGKDKSTNQLGLGLAAPNQLSYFDPGRDFSGPSGKTLFLPAGYAPFQAQQINSMTRRLAWDDLAQRPSLPRNVSAEQEQRIRSLFVVRAGYVEPFPEGNIVRAVAIADEKPKPPPPPPTKVAETQSWRDWEVDLKAGLTPNSWLAVIAGITLVAFLSKASSAASNAISGDKGNFWRKVIVESVALTISGSLLYWFGIVDEIKMLAIPLAGGFSLALLWSLKSG